MKLKVKMSKENTLHVKKPVFQKYSSSTTIYLSPETKMIWDSIPRGKRNEFINDLILISKGILQRGTIRFIDYRRIREIVREELKRYKE